MSQNIIVIASSTGGPRALEQLFTEMPSLNAAIILIQHMPKFMNAKLAAYLAGCSGLEAKVIKNGEMIKNGVIYVAPSDIHTEVVNNRKLILQDGAKVNYVKPAADVTMLSLIKCAGDRIIGIVLTGMGTDGARGLSHIKKLGGITFAQDEKSSAIYGMPKAAYDTGNVDYVRNIASIRHALIQLNSTNSKTSNS